MLVSSSFLPTSTLPIAERRGLLHRLLAARKCGRKRLPEAVKSSLPLPLAWQTWVEVEGRVLDMIVESVRGNERGIERGIVVC